MPTPNYSREADATICPDCGEDLVHHRCGARIRELNDRFRSEASLGDLRAAPTGELVVTRGVAARGPTFVERAVEAVRTYRAFTLTNDPWGEHDSGAFELDATELFWKIDYFDEEFEHGSPDPADPDATRRVLTILLAHEY
jgi:hypothetical protein